MPSPAFALEGKKVDKGVTNIRRVASPHWRRWLGPSSRCLVPFTSFSEPERLPDGKSQPVWFALDESRPLAFFAGVWTNWTSTRKVAEGPVIGDLFGLLTTGANRELGAIHPKAMPVILTEPHEWEAWLSAPSAEACTLQRPLPDGALSMVARGGKKDENEPTPTRASGSLLAEFYRTLTCWRYVRTPVGIDAYRAIPPLKRPVAPVFPKSLSTTPRYAARGGCLELHLSGALTRVRRP
ncbi:putative SOS response-associated peptidase YedK [Constrictibacter sp. MBR-5]|jgi:putative SOS response-associated peptidase YedK